MAESVKIDIKLLGRAFSIMAPATEQQTLEQALNLLNEKVSEIQNSGRLMDADKIAIMAALNIAHDMLKMKVGDGIELSDVQRRIRALSDSADSVLAKTSPDWESKSE